MFGVGAGAGARSRVVLALVAAPLGAGVPAVVAVAGPDRAPVAQSTTFAPELAVGGLVGAPRSFTREDLGGLAQVTLPVVYGSGPGIESGVFTGPRLLDVLDAARGPRVPAGAQRQAAHLSPGHGRGRLPGHHRLGGARPGLRRPTRPGRLAAGRAAVGRGAGDRPPGGAGGQAGRAPRGDHHPPRATGRGRPRNGRGDGGAAAGARRGPGSSRAPGRGGDAVGLIADLVQSVQEGPPRYVTRLAVGPRFTALAAASRPGSGGGGRGGRLHRGGRQPAALRRGRRNRGGHSGGARPAPGRPGLRGARGYRPRASRGGLPSPGAVRPASRTASGHRCRRRTPCSAPPWGGRGAPRRRERARSARPRERRAAPGGGRPLPEFGGDQGGATESWSWSCAPRETTCRQRRRRRCCRGRMWWGSLAAPWPTGPWRGCSPFAWQRRLRRADRPQHPPRAAAVRLRRRCPVRFTGRRPAGRSRRRGGRPGQRAHRQSGMRQVSLRPPRAPSRQRAGALG